MGIYDRNYSREMESGYTRSDTALVNFVKTTYKFLAGSLLLAFIGVMVGWYNPAAVFQYRVPLLFIELGLIFALGFVQNKPGVNLAVFAAFSFISGLSLVPLLAVVAIKNTGLIAQAVAMTTIIFGIMSIYALKTTRDLGNLGVVLFWSALVIFVFGLLNAFVFKSSMGSFALSCIVVVVFSLYIAYDTQNIVKGRYDNPIIAAISLYLDILNIFKALLYILYSSDDK